MSNNHKRGFASMDKDKQKAIAASGGRAAHAQGKAHQYTSETGKEAGSKGGKAAHAKGTAHEFTTDEARAAGKKSQARRTKKVSVSEENKRLTAKLEG